MHCWIGPSPPSKHHLQLTPLAVPACCRGSLLPAAARLFKQDKWRALLDRSNVEDLKSDRFHMFITDTFAVWMVARFALTYVSGLEYKLENKSGL